MTIYKRLIEDHDKQRDLCAKLEATSGDTPERRQLWEELKVELEAHAAAEEQVFYAALMKKPQATEEARHSVAEHQDMTKLIEDIDAMEFSSPGWLTKFKALAHDVIHHVDEEEQDVFPEAKDLITKDRAKDMADKFDDRKTAEEENQAA